MMPIVRRLSSALLVAMVGCHNAAAPDPQPPAENSGPLPALPAPQPPVQVGDLLLSASVGLYGDGETVPGVGFGAVAWNTGESPASLADLCVVQLRVYRDSDTPTAPAWTSPGQAARSCPTAGGLPAIPPGGQFDLRTALPSALVRARDILGDSLPEGRYAFAALVRVGEDTVEVPAGVLPLSRDTRPPLRDPARLDYAAAVHTEGTAPRELVARVVARNPMDRNVYLEFGACSLRLRAYRTPERTGRPVWYSERRQPPQGGGYVCFSYLATRLVTPGQAISPSEFNVRIPLHEVLADSLPSGRYYFTAVLDFQRGAGATLAHDTVGIPAGSVDLVSDADPLPQEREVGGVRYRAEAMPNPDAPGTVRVTLSAINTGPERVIFGGSRGITCPGQLLGYRSAARRDQWYLGGDVDWASTSCPIDLPLTWLAPGESRTFTWPVPVGTGRVPTGRYHLALVLWLDQGPYGGSGRIVLSAGDVVLGGN